MKQFKNIIFRQWITSDPKRLRDEIGENKNVIPNTKNFPYIYTIIETAKQDPETLQCIFYLGNNLSDMQKQKIKEIEELAQNIFTIQFDSKELKPLWEKYNFQTRTDLLNPLLQEGKEIDILSWLSEPNDDSLMGFRVDFMRILMLLEGKSALTASGRLKEIEISKDAPIIYLDFDWFVYGTIKNFKAPHGILFPVSINSNNLFYLANPMIAVTKDNHDVLQNTVKTIKGYFSIEHKNYFDQLIKHLDDAFKINHLNNSDKHKILLKSFLYDLEHNNISNMSQSDYLGAYYLRYILDWKKGAYVQKLSINNSDHLDPQLSSHVMQYFVYSITSGCLAEFLAEQKNKTKIQNQDNFWDYLYEDYTEKSNVIKSEKENVNILSSISNLINVPRVIGITDHITQSWKGNTFDVMYKQE